MNQRSPPRFIFAASLWLALLAAVLGAANAESPARKPQDAVKKALVLIQKSATEYTIQRECFSCHHQTLSVLALTTARDRHFPVSRLLLDGQLTFTLAFFTRGRESYRAGRGQGGGASTAGYGLWALGLGEKPSDDTTAAVVEFLLQRDAAFGGWRASTQRPPSEGSHFATTTVVLQALKSYAPADQKARVEERVAKARDWLIRTPPQDHEDRVFRLWALRLAGAPLETVQAAGRALVETQQEDGGWAQDERSPSDAYATGTALVALHHPDNLRADGARYQRGIQFLMRTQLPDGSWHVRTRSRPIQTHFETGFPHGKDQFISMAATCWATTALALAFEKR